MPRIISLKTPRNHGDIRSGIFAFAMAAILRDKICLNKMQAIAGQLAENYF